MQVAFVSIADKYIVLEIDIINYIFVVILLIVADTYLTDLHNSADNYIQDIYNFHNLVFYTDIDNLVFYTDFDN